MSIMKYKQEVQKYGKKDAIVALCVFIVVTALVTVLSSLSAIYPDMSTALGVIVRVVIVGMVFAIVIAKKQGLASIGIHKDRLWPALRFSLLLILIFSAFSIVPGLIYGWEFASIGVFAPFLLITIINAAGEDIFFVGYFQTRLHGLIRNDALAILAGAVGFALAHVPTMLLSPSESQAQSGMVAMWIIWMIGHTLMVLILRRHFSIIPVIVAHTLGNFLSTGGLWVEFNSADDWTGTAMLLVLLVLVILEIVRWRRSKHERVV